MKRVCFLNVIILFITACSSTKYIEGTVVDYDTLKPISNTIVSANQRGWGVTENGGIIWDKNYTYQTLSNDQGKFNLEYEVGSNAHIIASKDGYITYDNWHKPNSSIQIKLKRSTEVNPSLENGMLQFGFKDFKSYGWIFAQKQMTLQPHDADIFPVFNHDFDRKNIDLSTSGDGGFVFVPINELEVETGSDLLIYSGSAPTDGYTPVVTLNFDGEAGIYFVRTNDGKHYAKFVFDPASYATIGSERDYQQGNWGLMLEYVYNPSGTRNLEFQR